MIHQPWGGLQGQVTDIEIHTKELLTLRGKINEILSFHTGQSIEKIEKDTDRNFFMSPEMAKEYGIIDEVIFKMKTLEEQKKS
jgi:ATP-dependent Clp protease protease subunit